MSDSDYRQEECKESDVDRLESKPSEVAEEEVAEEEVTEEEVTEEEVTEEEVTEEEVTEEERAVRKDYVAQYQERADYWNRMAFCSGLAFASFGLVAFSLGSFIEGNGSWLRGIGGFGLFSSMGAAVFRFCSKTGNKAQERAEAIEAQLTNVKQDKSER